MLTVVIPVLLFVLVVFALYSYLVAALDPFHVSLIAGTVALLALSVVLVGMDVSMGVSLLIAAVAPLVVVVGYEARATVTSRKRCSERSGPTNRTSENCNGVLFRTVSPRVER